MRAWYRNLDYLTLFAWVCLVAVGLTAIYSTTHGPSAEYLLDSVKKNFQRQLTWGVISGGFILFALLMPVRFWQRIAYPAYLVTVGLCVAALVAGKEVNGAKAWFVIGGFSIQVSELAKVGTVLAVAHLLSSRKPNQANVRYAAMAVLLLLIPAAIILLQNDTGTALVFLGLIPLMLFWSGLPMSACLLMLAPAVAGYFSIVFMPAAIIFSIVFVIGMALYTRTKYLVVAALLFSGGTTAVAGIALNNVLQPHQKARIVSFTNPEAPEYRKGVGFHLVQSKAAIGSGGLTGKGFTKGTQTQGAFIPEQSTDFAFTVIAEEFGFIGSITVLILFGILLTRLVTLGARVKHPFGSMVAAGAAGIFLIHVFVNLGMVTGLLPVIGIPLPFISYGGASLLANTVMLGIVVALHMRRDDFSIYGY